MNSFEQNMEPAAEQQVPEQQAAEQQVPEQQESEQQGSEQQVPEQQVPETPETGMPEATAPEGQPVKKQKMKKKAGFLTGLIVGLLVMLLASVLYKGYIRLRFGRYGIFDVKLPTYELFHGSKDINKINLDELSRKVSEIEGQLDASYYYEKNAKDLEDCLYGGMMYGLEDPYAEYFPVEYFQEKQMDMAGNYVGLGVTVTLDEDGRGILVVEVDPQGPAHKAGILVDDVIIRADGVDLRELPLEESISEHIKGPEGSSVHLELLRNGQTVELDCERKKISKKSVRSCSFKTEDGRRIGYIHVSEFDGSCAENFAGSIDKFTEEGDAGIVIDLRDNPGGDMEVSLQMADYILPDKSDLFADRKSAGEKDRALLLTAEYKTGEPDRYYCSDDYSVDLPIVIIVNENSASASEIFTGVLQDYGYTVVGQTSFGKGIFQSVCQLADHSAIKFTSGQYGLPSGRHIHEIGIEPDIKSEPSERLLKEGFDPMEPRPDYDNQLAAAIDALK